MNPLYYLRDPQTSFLVTFSLKVMLMSVLIKNLVKKSFYRKIKKKTINVLTVFFISHKSDVKTFFNWIFNQCLKGTYYHFSFIKNGSYGTIHTFKNYFTTIFSVFSFLVES